MSAPRVLVVALALLAGACAALPAAHPTSRITDANALASQATLSDVAASDASIPSKTWWRAFADPQLDALIAEGLSGSPTLRVADARLREALGRAGIANAARLPQLNAAATSTRERFSEAGILPPPFAGHWDTLSELSATLSWDLDLWGRARQSHAAQLDAAHATAVDAEAARLALSVAIAHAYVQLDRAYQQLDVASDTLSQREAIFSLTRARNAAGIDSRLELKQAESALPAARAQVLQAKETIALTRDALAALLGQGPDRGQAIARPQPRALGELAIPSRLPADLLGRRPDIVAQRLRVESARHAVSAAKADFYPNVNLTALVGFQYLGTGNLLTAANRELGAGPALSLPIFDGHRRRAALVVEDAGYDAAVEGYNQLLADALRQVADQLVSARSVDAQRAEQKLGLATAEDAYQLAVLRYREGVGNYLQVLTTETQLLGQRALEVELRARALDVSIELIHALGGGFEERSNTAHGGA